MKSKGRIPAIVYCHDSLSNLDGKTTHGLLKVSNRFKILAILDPSYSVSTINTDYGEIIRIFPTLKAALTSLRCRIKAFIIGIAPTGFGEKERLIKDTKIALAAKLDIYNGTPLLLSKIETLSKLAKKNNCKIKDLRIPKTEKLNYFSGKILKIPCPRLVVIGNDCAVGKRTTTLKLSDMLSEMGVSNIVIGTGQTAWLQGVKYGLVLDTVPLLYASGELENQILKAYYENAPKLIIIEGQASIFNPVFSAEAATILISSLPNFIVYVLDPWREQYTDFPDFPIKKFKKELDIILEISKSKLLGLVINDKNKKQKISFSFKRLKNVPIAIGLKSSLKGIAENISRELEEYQKNGKSTEEAI